MDTQGVVYVADRGNSGAGGRDSKTQTVLPFTGLNDPDGSTTPATSMRHRHRQQVVKLE